MIRRISRRGLLAGSLGTVFVTMSALPARCRGRIYPGTLVHGIDVSGKSVAGSETLLRDSLNDFERLAVTYTFEGQRWTVGLADIGVTIDYSTTIEQALAHGRDGTLVERYSVLLTEGDERDISLTLRRDEDAMRAKLGYIGDQIALEPRSASLEIQDDLVVIADEAHGRKLDLDSAVDATNLAITRGEPRTIELTTVPVEPSKKASDLFDAREAANRLISEPVVFTYDDLSYPIDVSSLTAALVLDDGSSARLDASKLAPRLDAIANVIHVPAQNVKLSWDDGLHVVEDDIDGVRVDLDALALAVPTLAELADRTAPLPVVAVKAAARADNIKELGIEDHLAFGASSFAGSSEARAENVAVSARNISYQLVAPGGVFSFNDLLGAITPENGFVEGTIIEGDFAASDIGGGVCQVSTTVFRAAALAGFQFEEWHPHTWRLAFYEADGTPPGFDGAIYQPNTEWEIEMDLRFVNSLDSWLLLQVLIDGDVVSAHFYGRPKGWQVEIGSARLGEPKPIPEPVERVNPILAPGDRIKVQKAQAGVLVHIRRTVTSGGDTVISDGDFVSDYQSVPETWEIGPG